MASNQEYIYREWQYPRIGSFLPLVLFIPAVWIVAAPFNTNIGFVIGIAMALIGALLKILASKRIVLTDESLFLGDAIIPRKALGQITEIAKDDQFAERGSNLDARAYVFLKYGLPEILKIEIKDPKDPTPYLLISTRNGAGLISAIKN